MVGTKNPALMYFLAVTVFQDAKFVSFGNTLKVTNVDDVILYLNASDIVMNDFSVKDAKFCIALRPWMNIHPAAEFRCIVINNVLRG